jgi:hypothetical protein
MAPIHKIAMFAMPHVEIKLHSQQEVKLSLNESMPMDLVAFSSRMFAMFAYMSSFGIITYLSLSVRVKSSLYYFLN